MSDIQISSHFTCKLKYIIDYINIDYSTVFNKPFYKPSTIKILDNIDNSILSINIEINKPLTKIELISKFNQYWKNIKNKLLISVEPINNNSNKDIAIYNISIYDSKIYIL